MNNSGGKIWVHKKTLKIEGEQSLLEAKTCRKCLHDTTWNTGYRRWE